MEDWKELIKDYLDEAYSLIDSLEESLLSLEKDLENQAGINTVFRVAHTLKGGAGAVGFEDVQKLTHIMEDVLDLVRNKKYNLTQDDISLLLEVKDELQALLNAHENGEKHSFDKTASLIQSLQNIQNSVMNESGTTISAQEENMVSLDGLPFVARFNITPELLASIREALFADERLAFIEINLNENYELKEVGPYEILSLINNFAEPIIMNPDPEAMELDYHPYLNVVIETKEDEDYLIKKLSVDEVVTSVQVHMLDEVLYQTLETELNMVITDPEPVVSNSTPENTQDEQTVPSVSSEEVPAVPVEKPKVEEDKKNHTLRVESSKIDELLNLLGELVIIRSGFVQFETEIERNLQDMRMALRNFLSSSLNLPLYEDETQNEQRNILLRETISKMGAGLDNYMESVQQFSRISGTLQGRMMNLRMVPVQTVFSRFPRLIRDIAKQLDKKIELFMEGGETEIDKGMIDDLYDPLMHMIRNSLDHGLETPDIRVANGKTDTGSITLRAYQEGDSIFIEIEDDGKGIDAEVIKEKAIKKGFITTDQAQKLDVKDALSLIFLPGFSTAEQISNLSGRGVGMDVVRKKIEELGGHVSLNSILGKGTLIRIQLPLTLAIIQGLLVLIEGVHYVVPVGTVEETVILEGQNILKLNHYYALEFREKLIPLIFLPKMLYNVDQSELIAKHLNEQDIETETIENIEVSMPEFIDDSDHEFYQHNTLQQTSSHLNSLGYCIIIRYGTRQVGLVVPEILGEQDIVIKPLDSRILKSPGISAATIVGNGEVGFILDIPQIVRYYLKNQ